MKQPLIELQHITKAFRLHQVLESLNLTIHHGEFLTILGPSGCGKTTLLRLLAGFEVPDAGQILLNGEEISAIPAEQRHVNMVFQSYALFPHMSIYENVAFGLKCQDLSRKEIHQRVIEGLARVKLTELASRKPKSLSGGQQQRVAIARAIVNQPLVLLLDEPLSALDYHLRKNMQLKLKQLQRKLGITFILVTHDQEEALSISDRIIVMNHGTIEQIGTPRDIYEKPKNVFVAKFVGEVNIFNCQVLNVNDSKIEVNIEDKLFYFNNKNNFQKNDWVSIAIRPEDITVLDQNEAKNTEKMLPGTVEQVIYKGSTVDLIVKLKNKKLISATAFFDEDDDELIYVVGEKVWVEWVSGWEVILPHEEESII